jgi:phospholipid/cholesterol/gamma-HCH transport system substrate-binding protein
MAREDSRVRETRQRRRPFYGGALILLLLGTAFFIFFLGDIVERFEKTYELVALVPDAPGVAARTPVWVSGRRAGEVQSVAILPTSMDTLGRVAVTMKLPVHLQPQIRADSRVRITSVNLMSEVVVDIVPGTPAAPVKAPGDTLRLEARPSAAQITARAQLLRSDLDTVLASLRSLEPAASARLADARRSMAAVDDAMLELQRLRSDLAANVGLASLRDPAFQASLQRAQARAAELPAMLSRVREGTTGLNDVQAAVARLQLRADTVRSQLDDVASLLGDPLGMPGRMQQDSALLRAVEATRTSLDSLVAEVRRNPLRFVF